MTILRVFGVSMVEEYEEAEEKNSKLHVEEKVDSSEVQVRTYFVLTPVVSSAVNKNFRGGSDPDFYLLYFL